jgi:beta-glucanase (GH16 family)
MTIHKFISTFIIFILLLSGCSAAEKKETVPQHITSSDDQSMELVWNDEFDYTGLPDETKWFYDIGGSGWGNNESQYYTFQRLENAKVEDGKLIITAIKEDFEGKAYTSARLNTKQKEDWTFGRFEIRAKLPSGTGTWPAIWMLPISIEYGSWPRSGEIDIMEYVGFDMGNVHGTVHSAKYYHGNGTQKGGSIMVPDADTAFHTYAIEWSAEKIEWFLDGESYFSVIYEEADKGDNGWQAWPFDHPFYLIMNIAVGGNWGGQEGIDDSIFPQTMEVDYVRVYQ